MFKFLASHVTANSVSSKSIMFGGDQVKVAVIDNYLSNLKNVPENRLNDMEKTISQHLKYNIAKKDMILRKAKAPSNKIRFSEFIDILTQFNSLKEITPITVANKRTKGMDAVRNKISKLFIKELSNNSHMTSTDTNKVRNEDEMEREIIKETSDFDINTIVKRFPIILSYMNRIKTLIEADLKDLDENNVTKAMYEIIYLLWEKDFTLLRKNKAVSQHLIEYKYYLPNIATSSTANTEQMTKVNLCLPKQNYGLLKPILEQNEECYKYISPDIDGKLFYKTMVEFMDNEEYKTDILHYCKQPSAIIRDFFILCKAFTKFLSEDDKTLDSDLVEVLSDEDKTKNLTLSDIKLSIFDFKKLLIGNPDNKNNEYIITDIEDKTKIVKGKSLSYYINSNHFSKEQLNKYNRIQDWATSINDEDTSLDYNLKVYRDDNLLSKVEKSGFEVSQLSPTLRKNLILRNSCLRIIKDISSLDKTNADNELTVIDSVIKRILFNEFKSDIVRNTYSPKEYISFFESNLDVLMRPSLIKSLFCTELGKDHNILVPYDDSQVIFTYKSSEYKNLYGAFLDKLTNGYKQECREIVKPILDRHCNYLINTVVDELSLLNKKNNWNIKALYNPEFFKDDLRRKSLTYKIGRFEYKKCLNKLVTIPESYIKYSDDSAGIKMDYTTITPDGIVILCKNLFNKDKFYFVPITQYLSKECGEITINEETGKIENILTYINKLREE